MKRRTKNGLFLAAVCGLVTLAAEQVSAQSRFPARNGGGPVRYPGRNGGMVGQPQYAQPAMPNGGGFLAPTFERGRGQQTPSGGFRPRVDFFPSFGGGYGPSWYGGTPYGTFSPYGDYYTPYPSQPFVGRHGYRQPASATVKLRIEPKHAALYLDGNLIGTADEFDRPGALLRLHPGSYLLEAAAPGYRSLAVELRLRPGRTLIVVRTLPPGSSARRKSNTARSY